MNRDSESYSSDKVPKKRYMTFVKTDKEDSG